MNKIVAVLIIIFILLLWYNSYYSEDKGIFGLWFDADGKCGVQDAYTFKKIDGVNMETIYKRTVGSTTYNNKYTTNDDSMIIIYGNEWNFPWTLKASGTNATLTKKDITVRLSRNPKACA